MDFQIELATPADDAGIRRLLANNPVPGHPPVIYAREPNYFQGCTTMGDFWQVIVARHVPTGEIAGLGCRAIRTLWVNGQPCRVGYLGQLRIDEKFRGRWLVQQGYRFFQALDADGRCDGYITTIIDGNTLAERLLVTAARASLPLYRFLDRLVTVTLPVHGAGKVATVSAPAVIDFLTAHGSRRQFFPVWRAEELAAVEFVTEGEAGVMGLWDQSAYKQTIIPGRGALRLAYGCAVCVRNDDAGVFDRLLDQLLALAARRGLEYVVIGFSARDPLLPVAQRRPHIAYESRLYTVGLPGKEDFHEQLDQRIPSVELATL